MVSKIRLKILSIEFDTSKAKKWVSAAALGVGILVCLNTVFILELMMDDFFPLLADYMERLRSEATTWPHRMSLKLWGITMAFWMMFVAWSVILSPMIGRSEKRCPCPNCGGADG